MESFERQGTKCKTQHLFYRLKQALIENFDLKRQDIKVTSSLAELFPVIEKRRIYLAFGETLKWELPELVLTPAWRKALNIFGLCIIGGSLITVIVFICFFDRSKSLLLIPVAATFVTGMVSKKLNPKRTVIEPDRMSDYVNKILVNNYKMLNADQQTSRAEMEIVMNNIIAEMAGLEIEEITPDKKIGDDLGIN